MRQLLLHACTASFLGGAVFALDRYLKWIAHTGAQQSVYVVKPWLGFEFFANHGAAFGIPFPSQVALVVTPMLFVVFFVWVKQYVSYMWSYYAISLFVVGGLSNYIDRVLYEITIDYIRILTAIINIADVAVLAGIMIVFLFSKKSTSEEKKSL